ncbi:MAG: methyltransferase domain-containing protein [Polyangiaceae bacterium]
MSDVRDTSFGEGYAPSVVDRFGVWLSAVQLRKAVPEFRGKRIGDFGCGFNAQFVRSILDEIASGVLIDVSVAPDLKAHPKLRVHEGDLKLQLAHVPDASLDVVMCVSVLEHVWDPGAVLSEFYRILAPGGVCMLNVPSWRGKTFLEFSAFRLGASPKFEMDDHKMYYDVRDLWPLLVKTGFKPSDIDCRSHKFGLNTFAACRKS